MNLGHITTLSVECDAVKLGLDACALEVAQYQATWHNTPHRNAEMYFYTLLLSDP